MWALWLSAVRTQNVQGFRDVAMGQAARDEKGDLSLPLGESTGPSRRGVVTSVAAA